MKHIKKQLRDLTPQEFYRWCKQNCNYDCKKCLFGKVDCNYDDMKNSWVKNKWLYEDIFLDKEIEFDMEEPKLSAGEYYILAYHDLYLNNDYNYIARDEDGLLILYSERPTKKIKKGIGQWVSRGGAQILPFKNLFKFIHWEDKEPYLIEDLLKEEEIRMEFISDYVIVKNKDIYNVYDVNYIAIMSDGEKRIYITKYDNVYLEYDWEYVGNYFSRTAVNRKYLGKLVYRTGNIEDCAIKFAELKGYKHVD